MNANTKKKYTYTLSAFTLQPYQSIQQHKMKRKELISEHCMYSNFSFVSLQSSAGAPLTGDNTTSFLLLASTWVVWLIKKKIKSRTLMQKRMKLYNHINRYCIPIFFSQSPSFHVLVIFAIADFYCRGFKIEL